MSSSTAAPPGLTPLTPPAAPARGAPVSGAPRMQRLRQDRLLAGVATGLAAHLRLSLIKVRIGFVALSVLAGFGVALYAGLWLCAPLADETMPRTPGLAAAQRSGLRTSTRWLRTGDAGQLVAFAVLGVGLLILAQTTVFGVDPALFWPALLIGSGVVLAWRQDEDELTTHELGGRAGATRLRATTDRRTVRAGADRARALISRRGWLPALRIAAGAVLILAGLSYFVVSSGRLDVATDVFLGGLVATVSIALVSAPWLLRSSRSLRAERAERILSQERADVAAHLHDSVLQTLALIQRQAEDPRAVVRLARSQERDLRGWLYGHQQAPDASFRAALERVAAEVEEEYGPPVEVVVVGDCPLDDHLRAVVQAAREALVNAAKHAAASRTDLYAEVEADSVAVYVRDRGVGFNPSAVNDGRLGVRRSIIERMTRHGGRAAIRSAPGEGTEVRLEMARSR